MDVHADSRQAAREYRRILLISLISAAMAIPGMAIGFYLTYRAITWIGT